MEEKEEKKKVRKNYRIFILYLKILREKINKYRGKCMEP